MDHHLLAEVVWDVEVVVLHPTVADLVDHLVDLAAMDQVVVVDMVWEEDEVPIDTVLLVVAVIGIEAEVVVIDMVVVEESIESVIVRGVQNGGTAAETEVGVAIRSQLLQLGYCTFGRTKDLFLLVIILRFFYHYTNGICNTQPYTIGIFFCEDAVVQWGVH